MASPPSPTAVLANLQATALTARCHNAFFRLKQLKALHDVLRQNSSAIKDALKQDLRAEEEEAIAEVALALGVVKDEYSQLDAKKELEEEYSLAQGKDASKRREPWGVAYIEPQWSHTPFFSIIAALSAALTAGNCVALKLENSLRALPSLLRTLLSSALEADTFGIISSTPSQESLSTCLQVLQETAVSSPTHSQLVSPRSRVVAIVDRTADLDLAASQLVTARFAFRGISPYAPDLVFVNEFIKKDFLERVLAHSLRFLAGGNNITTPSASASARDQKKPSHVSSALHTLSTTKSWKLNIITQGDHGAIADLSHVTALPPKSSAPVLCIAPITSLEHAISLVDEALAPQETLLAAYHFGAPAMGKYLAQFVAADASFVNHVPLRLLLGPAAPAFHAVEVGTRYTVRQFSRAAPAFVAVSKEQGALADVLVGKEGRKGAQVLLAEATQEIREVKRPEWIALGYFEQGIFIGLGVYGIPLLACVGATLFFGVRAGLRRWAFQ